MTASSFGPHGEPEFKDGDAPDTALNPSQVGKYAALVGNRRIGTTAQRQAALTEAPSTTGTGVWEGLEWFDTQARALYVLMDGAWQQVSGTWTGTCTQSVGQGGPSGVGRFSRTGGQSSPAADFMSMGGDGRFVLARGSYAMTATMTLTGSRSAGRTFVEIIDTGQPNVGIARGLIPPGVGEDTVSAALTTWTDGTRQFRVQLIQNSGQIQDIAFRLAVTKVS
jgi:hypothetical protein